MLYGSTALLPLFLQTLLGYPAVVSGLAVSPRGLGSIVSMVVVGRLIGKIDSRYLIMFGFAVLAYSTYMLTGINLDIANGDIILPIILSGFAMGFVFVPLTTLAMGTLSNEQVGNAAGIYNLMRNAGGSIGIAAMVAFLARGGQTHLVPLVSHLSPYDPAFQQMFQRIQGGLAQHTDIASATQQTYGAIYGIAVRQAMLLSYIDNFRLLAILCALCVPTAFLFKRVKAGKKPPPGVH